MEINESFQTVQGHNVFMFSFIGKTKENHW